VKEAFARRTVDEEDEPIDDFDALTVDMFRACYDTARDRDTARKQGSFQEGDALDVLTILVDEEDLEFTKAATYAESCKADGYDEKEENSDDEEEMDVDEVPDVTPGHTGDKRTTLKDSKAASSVADRANKALSTLKEFDTATTTADSEKGWLDNLQAPENEEEEEEKDTDQLKKENRKYWADAQSQQAKKRKQLASKSDPSTAAASSASASSSSGTQAPKVKKVKK
jgi:hypothetical protein